MIFVRENTHMNTHLHQSKSLIPTKKRSKKEPEKEKEKEREANKQAREPMEIFKKEEENKREEGEGVGEFGTRIIPLSLPTCSQLPTMGKARGPGGSFSLGALSFTTTIPTTTARNKACNRVVKFNQGLLLDKTLATTPSSSLATTTELVDTRPTNPTTPRTSATATDLHGPILTHPKQKKTPQWGPLLLLLFLLLLLLHDTKCDQIPPKNIFFVGSLLQRIWSLLLTCLSQAQLIPSC